LASVILSIGLMYYISGEESVEIEKRVYLRIVPPQGMTVIGGPRREIKVTLSARRNVLTLLSTQKIVAQHRIRGVVKSGEYSFSLRAHDIDVPHPAISVIDITPKVVTVSLDEVVTKKLLVKANIVEEPAIGYAVDYDNILLDPTAALVKGPKSKLENKKFILTDDIDVVGRMRSFRTRVSLRYSAQYSLASKELIDVFVPIRQESIEKIVESVSINVLQNSSSDYFVTIDPIVINVPLKGPETIVQKIDKKDILAYINVSELSRGEYQLPLMLTLPPEVSLASDVPVITVNIDEKMKKIMSSPSAVTPSTELVPKEEGSKK